MAFTTAILQFDDTKDVHKMPELKEKLEAVSGIRFAYYYPDRKQVHVKYDPEKVVLGQIRGVMQELGLKAALR
jgi:copper chaperone CopZ